jgi:hypothetical protein
MEVESMSVDDKVKPDEHPGNERQEQEKSYNRLETGFRVYVAPDGTVSLNPVDVKEWYG